MRVERLADGPIIHAGSHPSIGENIQGPSLVRVPDTLEARLGRYYLYFADHKGGYIRLAFADALTGPWTVHPPGSLQLEQSHFPTEPPEISDELRRDVEAYIEREGTTIQHDLIQELTTPHVASPDVHVSDDGTFVMYFHGLAGPGHQVTRVATSRDGVHYEAQPQILGDTYLRAFHDDGMTYALAMPGRLYRSRDGFTDFEKGPLLFNKDMRHVALLRRNNLLHVFWTQVGHTPERILVSTIDVSGDWQAWKESDPVEVLRPERDWEGADVPLEPSVRSVAYGHVNQLRDPCIYEEEDRIYLLYAVAGESGIAIAEVHID